MVRREKYVDWKFDIKECEIHFNIIEKGKEDPGYGTVFMNVKFPDGRWIAFKSVEDMRVPIYRENLKKAEAKVDA